jgi:hypothetical protein
MRTGLFTMPRDCGEKLNKKMKKLTQYKIKAASFSPCNNLFRNQYP